MYIYIYIERNQIYINKNKHINIIIYKICKKSFFIIRRISGPEDYRNDPWKNLRYGWKISREV